MKGRPILVEYQNEPRSLSEIGRLIGVSPRAMNNRWHKGKRPPEIFAPCNERMKRRGQWGVGDVAATDKLCKMTAQ